MDVVYRGCIVLHWHGCREDDWDITKLLLDLTESNAGMCTPNAIDSELPLRSKVRYQERTKVIERGTLLARTIVDPCSSVRRVPVLYTLRCSAT